MGDSMLQRKVIRGHETIDRIITEDPTLKAIAETTKLHGGDKIYSYTILESKRDKYQLELFKNDVYNNNTTLR